MEISEKSEISSNGPAKSKFNACADLQGHQAKVNYLPAEDAKQQTARFSALRFSINPISRNQSDGARLLFCEAS